MQNGLGAWTEWYPAWPVWVDFPVQVGDLIAVIVVSQGYYTYVAWFFDPSQGVFMCYSVEGPGVDGVSAEWIVECPGNESYALPDSSTVTFQQTAGLTASGTLFDASSAAPVNMTDANGGILASAEISGDTVQVTWEWA